MVSGVRTSGPRLVWASLRNSEGGAPTERVMEMRGVASIRALFIRNVDSTWFSTVFSELHFPLGTAAATRVHLTHQQALSIINSDRYSVKVRELGLSYSVDTANRRATQPCPQKHSRHGPQSKLASGPPSA